MTTRPPADDGLGQIRANLVSQITDRHVGVLRTVIRRELTRNAKKRVRLIETFGADADVEHVDGKHDLLRDLYRMLGGDPDDREEPERSGDGPPAVGDLVRIVPGDTMFDRPIWTNQELGRVTGFTSTGRIRVHVGDADGGRTLTFRPQDVRGERETP